MAQTPMLGRRYSAARATQSPSLSREIGDFANELRKQIRRRDADGNGLPVAIISYSQSASYGEVDLQNVGPLSIRHFVNKSFSADFRMI